MHALVRRLCLQVNVRHVIVLQTLGIQGGNANANQFSFVLVESEAICGHPMFKGFNTVLEVGCSWLYMFRLIMNAQLTDGCDYVVCKWYQVRVLLSKQKKCYDSGDRWVTSCWIVTVQKLTDLQQKLDAWCWAAFGCWARNARLSAQAKDGQRTGPSLRSWPGDAAFPPDVGHPVVTVHTPWPWCAGQLVSTGWPTAEQQFLPALTAVNSVPVM